MNMAPNIPQLLTTLVGFLILVWIMKKYAWGPVLDMLDARRDKIENDYAAAEKELSEAEKTGTSTGKPPASKTPCFTRSAITLRCALQGVSSDQVFRIPITGRPSNKSWGNPWFFIQPRW